MCAETQTDVENMTVAQLRQQLRSRNLPFEGKKKELQIRLLQDLSKVSTTDYLQVSEFEKFFKGYVEFHQSVSEELYELKLKRNSNELESITKLQKEIKFLRDELESKSTIIGILMKENERLRYNESTRNKNKFQINNNRNNRGLTVKPSPILHTSNRFESLPIDQSNSNETGISENDDSIEIMPANSNSNVFKQNVVIKEDRFIDRNPDRNVPSWEINRNPNTYANVVQRKPKPANILIIGDSIIRRIDRIRLNRNLTVGKAFIKAFPGATVNQLSHYIIPHLESNRPESIIIHVGTNDIAPRYESPKSSSDISNSILQIAEKCREFGVKNIFISGLTCRSLKSELDKVLEVNSFLMNACYEQNYYFINNNNIELGNLYEDGIHLADNGIDILEHNFFNSLERTRA